MRSIKPASMSIGNIILRLPKAHRNDKIYARKIEIFLSNIQKFHLNKQYHCVNKQYFCGCEAFKLKAQVNLANAFVIIHIVNCQVVNEESLCRRVGIIIVEIKLLTY